MGISAAAVVADDLAAQYVGEIEDLVAENSLQDALSRLQDFTKDFLPKLKQKVLVLRSRYNQFRLEQGSGVTSSENLNDIRNAILDFATHVLDEARLAAELAEAGRPSGKVHLIVDNAREASKPAKQNAKDPAPPPENVATDPPAATDSTLDTLRRQYFQLAWNQDELIACDCEGVSKKYKRGDFMLQPTSIQLRAGQITAVVGMNASGKTTFLRLLMGDLKPDSGTLRYPRLEREGKSWRHLKDQIAFVPQLPEKWHGRLRHNLNFVAAGHGKPGQDVRQLVEWNIARYGLQRYDDSTWDEISGGYKIRFELVRALVSQPKMLVLDEPLAYLDVIACQRFLADLKAIATSLEQPIPIVVTSQHLHEIETVADQLILLDNGVCKYAGSLEGVAALLPDCMLEITVAANRESVVAALSGTGLKEVERIMGGFILTFPKNSDVGVVFQRLHAAFGSNFKAFRDISGSARGLMGNVMQ